MNELTAQSNEPITYSPAAPGVAMFEPQMFEQMQRVAQALGASSLCPKHLRGKDAAETIGNCLRVVNQAYRWGFDPFAVADESYVVGGKLGYQGKLVAAVVNTRAGLEQRLAYTFSGEGPNRTVTVSGKFQGETEPRTVTVSVAQAKTPNEMWTKDPDQKLCYNGAIKWARRHKPEVLLGVLTDDDLDAMAHNITVESGNYRAIENGSKVQPSTLGDKLRAETQARSAPGNSGEKPAENPAAMDHPPEAGKKVGKGKSQLFDTAPDARTM